MLLSWRLQSAVQYCDCSLLTAIGDGLPLMRLTMLQILFIGVWLLSRETNVYQLDRLLILIVRRALALSTLGFDSVAEHGLMLKLSKSIFPLTYGIFTVVIEPRLAQYSLYFRCFWYTLISY